MPAPRAKWRPILPPPRLPKASRDRRINEAKSYHETTTALAKSTAKAKLERRTARSERTILTAQARALRFNALQGEVAKSRVLTMRRIYLEAMQSLLSQVRATPSWSRRGRGST